jgi:hypothetical protein
MATILAQLTEMTGTFVGEGLNHDGQPFVGRLTLTPLLSGRGFRLQFEATGTDGTVYHKEESTIAPSVDSQLKLWNLNSNTPGLIPHDHRPSAPKSGALCSLIFGFNNSQDKHVFREEVTLDIWDPQRVSYSYAWGLPGCDFKERSSVSMTRMNQ